MFRPLPRAFIHPVRPSPFRLPNPSTLPPNHPRTSLSHPFSTTPRRVRYGGHTYRRFDGGPQRGQRLPVKPIAITIGGLGCLYIYNLETVEPTGRRRFNVVSHARELQIGSQQYNQVLQSTRSKILPDNHPTARSVNRVLKRLIPEAPIEGADWRVHVIHDDSTANAFVLPGGKVFVFTGILPVCGNEDGLAAVLAHEISHVSAHHHGERLSNSALVSGLVLLSTFLFDVTNLASMALDLGFSLPNSRVQEAEADEMGLMMMANACFPPEAAIKLWSRMEKIEKVRIPQFMSTHPTNYNRMEALREQLHKADSIYEAKGCHFLKDQVPGFQHASKPTSMRDPYF